MRGHMSQWCRGTEARARLCAMSRPVLRVGHAKGKTGSAHQHALVGPTRVRETVQKEKREKG